MSPREKFLLFVAAYLPIYSFESHSTCVLGLDYARKVPTKILDNLSPASMESCAYEVVQFLAGRKPRPDWLSDMPTQTQEGGLPYRGRS